MGNISSIHFERSKKHNTGHNDRTVKPKYLLGDNFECNLSYRDAENFYSELLNNASYAYTKRTGQKPQYREENLRWSAVVNIKPDTTMQDLQKLAVHFNNKYGFQCYQIAMHKDEGEPLFVDEEKKIPKLDKDGKQIYKQNLHAHLEFLMLNENGITCFKKKDFGIKKMKEIQTEVAEILGMERGKEDSKAKRLTHQQYKQEQKRIHEAKLEVKKELEEKHEQDIEKNYISKKEIAEQIGIARKRWIEEHSHSKEDYKRLNELKTGKYESVQDLIKEIDNLDAQVNKNKKTAQKLFNAVDDISKIVEVEIEDFSSLEQITQKVETLAKENKTLKQQPHESIEDSPRVKELKQEIDNLHEYYNNINTEFNFKLTVDDLRQCTKARFFSEDKAEDTAERLNKKIEDEVSSIVQKKLNTDYKLRQEQQKNEQLQGQIKILTAERDDWKNKFKYVIKELGIKFRDKVEETIKSFDIFRKYLAWGNLEQKNKIIENVGQSAFRKTVDYYGIKQAVEKQKEEVKNKQLEKEMGVQKKAEQKVKTEEHSIHL